MIKHMQTIRREIADELFECCRRIVWVCLTILLDWRLKG